MTPEQKKLVQALVVVNLLAWCIGLPVVVVGLDVGGSQTQGLSLIASLLPTPRPTLTPRPTASPTRPAPTPTLPPGWKLHSFAAEGFAIAVPPGWESLPLSDPTAFKAAVQSLQKKNPKLAAAIRDTPNNPLTKFYAVDMAPNALVDNIWASASVFRRTGVPAATMDEWGEAIGQTAKEMCGSQSGSVTPHRIQLPAGDAQYFRCVVAATRADGTRVSVTISQMLLLHGTDLYGIGLGNAPKVDSKYLPLVEKIANTFRWISK